MRDRLDNIYKEQKMTAHKPHNTGEATNMSHAHHAPTHGEYPATGELRPAAPQSLLLRNVRPYGEGSPVDVLLADGRIQAIEPTDSPAAAKLNADDQRDLGGNILLPGLVDMHVHLREPGREDTETIVTGSEAAARGGFTAVFTMLTHSQLLISR